MWDATVWALLTWLKFTALFAAVLGGCWLWFGLGSGQFALVAIAAALAEIHLIRLLNREWSHEASMHWWWSP